MRYNLIAICECGIDAKNEHEALCLLSNRIEDCVVSSGTVHRLKVVQAGPGIITND